MKLWHVIAIGSALAVGTAVAGLKPQDPLHVDPTIYNLKLNNERVRVFVVKFKPGQSIAAHRHPDHLVHALDGGKLMIREVGKDPVTMDVKTGMTVFLPAQSHSAKNLGKTTMRLLVIELK